MTLNLDPMLTSERSKTEILVSDQEGGAEQVAVHVERGMASAALEGVNITPVKLEGSIEEGGRLVGVEDGAAVLELAGIEQ